MSLLQTVRSQDKRQMALLHAVTHHDNRKPCSHTCGIKRNFFVFCFFVFLRINLRGEVMTCNDFRNKMIYARPTLEQPCAWILFLISRIHQDTKHKSAGIQHHTQVSASLVSSVGSMVIPLTGWYWVRIPVGLALHLHVTSSSCV